MKLIEHLSRGLIHRFEPAIQRSVEQHAAVGSQRSAVDLEHFIDRPFRLAGHLIERDQPAAHVAVRRPGTCSSVAPT